MRTGKKGMVLLAAMLALAGCGESSGGAVTIVEMQESALEAEQTTTVVRGDIQVASDLEAWVGPKIEQLTFEEDAYFGEYKVQLGDVVKKGDVLATPATTYMEDSIAEKKKQIENLTVTYNYNKASLENRIAIAKLELEDAYAQLETTEYATPEYTALCVRAGQADEQKKRLELQLTQLAETYELNLPYYQKQLAEMQEESTGNTIVAPFDGVVAALSNVSRGDEVSTKKYYVALADESVYYARCELLGVNTVKNMEQILFWKDNQTYETTFIQRDNEFYQEMRNYSDDGFTEFAVDAPEGTLSLGDYGLIRLISRSKEDVLLLPENTIVTFEGVNYVYKAVDGKKERVAVETGYKDGLMVEIVSGLEEGDVVYVQES